MKGHSEKLCIETDKDWTLYIGRAASGILKKFERTLADLYIRSENIELQAIEQGDYNKLAQILKDSQVMPYLFGYPSKLEGTTFEKWLLESRENKRSYYFAVRETESFEVAGICAYQDIDYKNGSVTVWAAIAPAFVQKGYGEKTLRALSCHAFDQHRMEHVALYCLENDHAGKAWAHSAGFTRDAVLSSRIKRADKRLALELYSLLKEEGDC